MASIVTRTPAPCQPTARRTTDRPTKTNIKSKWYATLRDGDGWDTAYTTAMKVMNAMAGAGWTWEDVVATWDGTQLYKDAYLTRSDNGRPKGSAAAFNQFRSDWLEAVRYTDPHENHDYTPPIDNKTSAYATILKIRHAADHHQWRGRSAIRDRIVLNALLVIADSLGTVNPQVSVRRLCEDTPYRNNQVISRAIQSLAERGWLTPDRTHLRRTDASIYRLHLPPRTGTEGRTLVGQNIASSTPVGTSARSVSTPSDGPNATRLAMALTPHQQAVYATLVKAPQSRNQIAKAAGVARLTVSRALMELAKAGLARQKVGPDGEVLGWVVGDTDPDDVVFERGVDAKVDARSERHKAERAQWEDHCEGRATDRQKAQERADKERRRQDAESLKNLAKRPPKARPKWRDDAAPFNAAVREEHDRKRREAGESRGSGRARGEDAPHER